jgi:hypothetical protein
MKPLFIPLKTEFYEAFDRGDKVNVRSFVYPST